MWADAGFLVGPRHDDAVQVVGDCGCYRVNRMGVTVPDVVDADGWLVRTAVDIDLS